MSNVAILDKTICINLVCTLWSGRRRLTRDDLGLGSDALPPEDLASIGSLKLCDPKELTKLNSIKRAAERDCDRVCVRFLSGYATDKDNEAELIAKLTERKQQFEAQAKLFVSTLHKEFDQWIAQHPQHEALIRKALPSVADVASRLSFDFQIYRVGAVDEDAASAVNRGLVQATGGLSQQLFAEIESEAQTTWKRTYDGRATVGQKALRPIRAIREKMQALQFLDARVLPLIEHIDAVLNAVPKSGTLEGSDYLSVVGLLRLLGDSERMAQHGASASSVETTSSAEAPAKGSSDEMSCSAGGNSKDGSNDSVAQSSHWF